METCKYGRGHTMVVLCRSISEFYRGYWGENPYTWVMPGPRTQQYAALDILLTVALTFKGHEPGVRCNILGDDLSSFD